MLTIIYKCVNGSAHGYLQNDIHNYTTTTTIRSLRSAADYTKLVVPSTIKSVGDKAFISYGPRVWNSLPQNIREAPSLNIFKKHLKSYLFPY